MLKKAMSECGMIAILRGLKSDEAAAMGDVLYRAGFRVIEVPLNSPQPYDSIRILRDTLPEDCIVGAGTVLGVGQVDQVREAGGELVVMPHSDNDVIRAAKAAGMYAAPGVATLTEAFAALAAGADILKMFPAEQLGPHVVKAWRAVVASDIALVPVGGINPDSMANFLAAGASGFGLGSALYKPGMTTEQVARTAGVFISAWQAAHAY
jgi:2-dehydro-3-deoxyphosphogalactonate aldolase